MFYVIAHALILLIASKIGLYAYDIEISKQELIQMPSAAFSKNILANIKTQRQTVTEPIISKRVWWITAAVITFTILISYLVITPETAPKAPSEMDWFLSALIVKLDTLPVIFPITIFVVGSLLFLDFVARQRIWGLRYKV